MKIKNIIMLMLVAGYCQAQSDTISVVEKTVRWKSTSFIDRATNDRVETLNTFVIDKGNTIEWNQATEDAKQVFTIKSLDDQWPRADQDGHVQYFFDCYGTEGTLTVQRQNGELSISLEIHGLRTGTLSLLFESNQMTY